MKIYKLYYISFWLLIISINLSAQTINKSGIISTYEEWSGTIKVTGDISIIQNGELIIKAGTFVEFQNQYKISVKENGRIKAIGNSSNSIIFKSLNLSNGWRGIRFDSMWISADSSIFNYCNISYCKTDEYNKGGAFTINKFSKIRFSNCKITSNRTNTNHGGGIHADSSNIIISDCEFYKNFSGYGAGLYITNSNPIIKNSIFRNNKTYWAGSSMYFKKSNLIISNCAILNDSIDSTGGESAYFESCKGTIINSKFLNNKNVGIYLLYSNMNIINTLIANNGMSGIKLDVSNPKIINSTIVNNFDYVVGGIKGWYSKPLIINTIIWNNFGIKNKNLLFTGYYPKIVNSNISGGKPLYLPDSLYINNICKYPQFVNSIDNYGVNASALNANWNIRPCSPCINKGNNNLFPDSLVYDLNANLRIYNDTIDIGAYEMQEHKTQTYGRRTIFVKEGGTGAGNSWNDAMGNLQDAINKPLECNTGIDIWLVKGIYYPDTTGLTVIGKASFNLRNNVAIYGGFIGNETLLEQRDYVSNISNLSGNFRKNENYSMRSFSVVKGIYLDSTSVLDGICVSDGYFNSFYTNGEGGGIYLSYSKIIIKNSIIQNNVSLDGGGIYLDNSNPSFINTIIQNNRADYGGGIYLWKSNPSFISSNIYSNKALYGAGCYISYSTPLFQSSRIINNDGIESGGGLELSGSSPKIINSIISNNSVSWGYGTGGGINCSSSSPLIINSLIANNKSGDAGAGIFYDSGSSPIIVNTIMWNNYGFYGLDNYSTYWDSNIKITNCNIEGGNRNGIPSNDYLSNIDELPRFVKPSPTIGVSQDGITADWSIKSYSPCINKGIFSLNIPSKDIAQNDRIYNDTIDIGPYEYIGNKTKLKDKQIVYVKPSGQGSGKSWNDATGNIQKAIDSDLGDYKTTEIWVAKGTYMPDTIGLKDHRDATFKPKKHIKIYGGFNGYEANRNERNWQQNITIFSGDIGVQNTINDNTFHVVTCRQLDTTSVIDGFTIEKGNAITNSSYGQGSGAGILCEYSDNILKNLVIRNNSTIEIYGGGIFCFISNINLSNSIIKNNTGGGVRTFYSYVTISNSEFLNNYGPSICTPLSYLFSINNKFINNIGSPCGGIALYSTNSVIVNCLFANNTCSGNYTVTGKGAGAIYSEDSKSAIINSTIVNNDGKDSKSAGGIYSNSYWNTNDTIDIYNSIIWHNKGILGNSLYKDNGNCKIVVSNTDIEKGNIMNLPNDDYVNNIDSIPSFVNPIQDFGISNNAFNANWSINQYSPCINKGLNYNLLFQLGEDILGNPRIYNGVVDLGGYEFQGDRVFPPNTLIDNNNDESLGNYTIFPNPASEFVILQNKEIVNSNIEIKIFSIDGKVIRSESYLMNESVNLDVGSLKNGIYLVQITNKGNHKQISKYFIKN